METERRDNENDEGKNEEECQRLFFNGGGRGGNGTDPTEDIRLWMPRIDQSDYSGIWGPRVISCRAADLEEC